MKIMKKFNKTVLILVVGLTVLLCAGCSEITPAQLKSADSICDEKGGVRMIMAYALKSNVVWRITR